MQSQGRQRLLITDALASLAGHLIAIFFKVLIRPFYTSMSLTLKYRKLKRMSRHEIKYRVGEHFRIRKERQAFEEEVQLLHAEGFNFFNSKFRSLMADFREGNVQGILQNTGWRRKFPISIDPLEHPNYADQHKAELFKELLPHEYEQSLLRAKVLLQRRYAFLGVEAHYPDKITWQNDPATGHKFPSGFYHDIDIFTSNGKVDIKHVWELNRLQFLIELAKAWYLTRETQYRDEIDVLVADWYKENPYKSGVAWTSALEVAVRAFSLFWTLNFYLATPNPTTRTVHLLLKLLYLSGKFIYENLSIYFSPYNHLIGELGALFMIGYLFPGFSEADVWQERAWDLLVDQIDKQFHKDGGTVEQATFYHHFTLGFYLQSAAFIRQNNGRIPAVLDQYIEKAIEFALYLTRPDGTLPWIGDIDAARSLYFSYPAHWDFRGFQAIGAIWYGRSDMKNASGGLREEAFWLLPGKEQEKFAHIPLIEPVMPFVNLPDSGYTVMRTGWQSEDHYSMIDCGPIADGLFKDSTPSAAHGHADLLSIEIAPFGESILIDPGFSNYRGGYQWHMHFRSTASHNTLEIDGLSQLEQIGILSWAYAPDFQTLQLYSGPHAHGFCGEHYAYHRLLDKPTHRRYFLFIDRCFWVSVDFVYSHMRNKAFEHQIVHHFHLNSQVDASWQNDRKTLLATGERAELCAHLLHPGVISTGSEIRIGGPKPQDGWISPTYRDRREAPVASVSFHHRLPFKLVTVYLPNVKDDGHVKILDKSHKQFTFRIDDKKYEIEVAHPKNGGVQTNYLATIKMHHARKALRLMDVVHVPNQGPNQKQTKMPIEEVEMVY